MYIFLDDLCVTVQGSHDHWCVTIIVSRIFVSPCCKEHLQDLCMAVLGREAERYRRVWGVGVGLLSIEICC